MAGTADVKCTMDWVVNDQQLGMVEQMLEVVFAPIGHAKRIRAGNEFSTRDLRLGLSVSESNPSSLWPLPNG